MTHDELLEKIERERKFLQQYIDGEGFVVIHALRVVVELHRPQEIKSLGGEVLDTYCYECEQLIDYPCPTIQAIEKELG
jgi:hypothetical protein